MRQVAAHVSGVLWHRSVLTVAIKFRCAGSKATTTRLGDIEPLAKRFQLRQLLKDLGSHLKISVNGENS